MIYCTAHDRLDDLAKLYAEWTGKPYSSERMLWNSFFAVARDTIAKEIVVATQYIVVDDPFWGRRYALVENVFVRETYRSQGVGKLLMEFTEQQVRLLGCEFLKLTTRKESGKKLYRSLGYEEGSSFYKK